MSLGSSPCIGATGDWSAWLVEACVVLGQSRVLGKALCGGLISILKVIHLISAVGINVQDGALPGRESEFTSCLQAH